MGVSRELVKQIARHVKTMHEKEKAMRWHEILLTIKWVADHFARLLGWGCIFYLLFFRYLFERG